MAFTLTKAGGGTVTALYLSISNSTATPASTWFAVGSTDGGGNSGWTFSAYSTTSQLTYNSKTVAIGTLCYRLQIDRKRLALRGTSANGIIETLNVRVDELVSIGWRNFASANATDATLRRNLQQWLQWAQKGGTWKIARDAGEMVETTVNGAAALGATSLTLTSTTGVLPGKTYIIRNETDYDIVNVATVNVWTNVVTLTEGLNYAFATLARFRSEHYWSGRLPESSVPIIEDPPLHFTFELDFLEDLNSI